MKKTVKFNWIMIAVFMICANVNAQNTVIKMLKNSKQQKEIFKAISGDSIQMRQFKRYLKKQKNTSPVIDKEGIVMGNTMNMMENDSILLERTHRE